MFRHHRRRGCPMLKRNLAHVCWRTTPPHTHTRTHTCHVRSVVRAYTPMPPRPCRPCSGTATPTRWSTPGSVLTPPARAARPPGRSRLASSLSAGSPAGRSCARRPRRSWSGSSSRSRRSLRRCRYSGPSSCTATSTLFWGHFTRISQLYANPARPVRHALLWCPCLSDADWCLRSEWRAQIPRVHSGRRRRPSKIRISSRPTRRTGSLSARQLRHFFRPFHAVFSA